MAVASIKREPFYDSLKNKENQLSILKLFKVFGTSMQLKLFRRPNSYCLYVVIVFIRLLANSVLTH